MLKTKHAKTRKQLFNIKQNQIHRNYTKNSKSLLKISATCSKKKQNKHKTLLQQLFFFNFAMKVKIDLKHSKFF